MSQIKQFRLSQRERQRLVVLGIALIALLAVRTVDGGSNSPRPGTGSPTSLLAPSRTCSEGCPDICLGDPCYIEALPTAVNSLANANEAPDGSHDLGSGEAPRRYFDECQITGDTDFCTYPGTGCPDGEESQDGCCYVWDTPLILDLNGDGFRLSNLAAGIVFPIGATSSPRQISWTLPASDDAWLVLDRDENGEIDNGSELFGDATPQPVPPIGERANGFRALAVFDHPTRGGNNNQKLDSGDEVFSRLRLWQDWNHNGIAEQRELVTLSSVGIVAIDLNYRDARRRDEFGNQFRYRSTVRSTGTVARSIFDVVLLSSRMGGE